MSINFLARKFSFRASVKALKKPLIVCLGPILSMGCQSSRSWQSRSSHDLVAFSQIQNIRKDSWNSSNLVLQLPQKLYGLDYRPELLLQYKRLYRWTLRPSFFLEQKETSYFGDSNAISQLRGRVNFIEAFMEGAPNQRWKWILGLQNFQWGAGDLMNPSNPMSHLRTRGRHLLAREKGRGVVRFSFTPNFETHWSLMSEIFSTPENEIMADESFAPSFFARYERSLRNGQSSLGTSFGIEAPQQLFIGPHFNLSSESGFSLYLDSRVSQKSISHRPSLTLLRMERSESSSPRSLILIGIRWEGDLDLRLENLHQSNGYSKEEYNNSLGLLSLPLASQASSFARFTNSGLEFWGRNLGLLSIRKNSIAGWADTHLAYRHLRSLMDDSRNHQLNLEFPIGIRGQGVILLQIAEGGSLQELSSLSNSGGEFFMKWAL